LRGGVILLHTAMTQYTPLSQSHTLVGLCACHLDSLRATDLKTEEFESSFGGVFWHMARARASCHGHAWCAAREHRLPTHRHERHSPSLRAHRASRHSCRMPSLRRSSHVLARSTCVLARGSLPCSGVSGRRISPHLTLGGRLPLGARLRGALSLAALLTLLPVTLTLREAHAFTDVR